MSLRYVPALPVKRGDVQGFADVAPELATQMAPLWTIPVFKATDGGGAPSQQQRLKQLARAAKHLKTLGAAGGWVDTVHVEADPGLVSEAFWGEFGLFITATPVTGPERPPAQQALASELARSGDCGLAVRLHVPEPPPADAGERVLDVVRRSAAEPETVDLLLDLGVLGDPADAIERGVCAFDALGEVLPWRNVVLLAGAFPASSQGWQRDRVSRLARPERAVWQAVSKRARNGLRLIYGDYSIVHPHKAAWASTGPVTILGKVLYTAAEEYLVVKGRPMSVYGAAQMPPLAERISGDPSFRGRDFSAGEQYIADCAQQLTAPGPPERWIRAGHTQHLTFVMNQPV